MRRRPPYDLRLPITAYNVLQIVCCGYVVYQSIVLCWLSHYSLICQPVAGPHAELIAWRVCYLYFLIKILDIFDTIFFVLRNKTSQMTFLHVYHHFGMVVVAWGIVKWVPGGHIILLVTVNSAVHVVMYTYYLLALWDDRYKRSSWKKTVTQLQIVQFSTMLAHFVALATAPRCSFPRPPAFILIPQNLFIVLLFGDFYYNTYVKPNNNKRVT